MEAVLCYCVKIMLSEIRNVPSVLITEHSRISHSWSSVGEVLLARSLCSTWESKISGSIHLVALWWGLPMLPWGLFRSRQLVRKKNILGGEGSIAKDSYDACTSPSLALDFQVQMHINDFFLIPNSTFTATTRAKLHRISGLFWRYEVSTENSQ